MTSRCPFVAGSTPDPSEAPLWQPRVGRPPTSDPHSPASHAAPHANGRWIFPPDGQSGKIDGPDTATEAPHRRRGRLRVAVAITAIGIGLLAMAHRLPFGPAAAGSAGPTHPPADVRGTWDVLVAYGSSLYVQTLHIRTENLSDGPFQGSVASPVGAETVTGTVHARSLSFVISLASGRETGTATVSTAGGRTHLFGAFTNAAGGRGTLTATRTSTES